MADVPYALWAVINKIRGVVIPPWNDDTLVVGRHWHIESGLHNPSQQERSRTKVCAPVKPDQIPDCRIKRKKIKKYAGF